MVREWVDVRAGWGKRVGGSGLREAGGAALVMLAHDDNGDIMDSSYTSPEAEHVYAQRLALTPPQESIATICCRAFSATKRPQPASDPPASVPTRSRTNGDTDPAMC